MPRDEALEMTDADIDALIVRTDYYVFPGTTTTVCAIKLSNGFVVTGTSACLSPASFEYEIGERWAFADARRKIWDLEAYLRLAMVAR